MEQFQKCSRHLAIFTCIVVVISSPLFFQPGLAVHQDEKTSSVSFEDVPEISNCKFNVKNGNFSVFCENINLDLLSLLPNETSKLVITKGKYLTLTKPIFAHLSKLKVLHLPANGIRYVISKSLIGLFMLTDVNLGDNLIVVLSPKLFRFTPSVKFLNLSHNNIQNFRSIAVSVSILPSLTELNLSHNKHASVIKVEDFHKLENCSLEKLYLHDCSIKVLEKGAFVRLKYLKFLDIGNNPLSENALKNLTTDLRELELEELRLQQLSRINDFPSHGLAPLENSSLIILILDKNYFMTVRPLPLMPRLRKLSMSYCNIKVLSDSFVNLPNLKELILTQNEIFFISSTITSLKHLRTLDMRFSARYVELFAFVFNDFGLSQMESLQNLTLNGMPINKSIKRHYFFGLKRLKYLHLANTKIVDIEAFSFETLKDLEILDLAYNSIKSLGDNLFYGLNNLRTLNLQENLISFTKDSLPFQHLSRLVGLKLRNNKIKTINSDMFSNLTCLTHLMLEGNLITSWNYDIFQNNSQLVVLLLRRNQINQVTDTMVKDFSRLTILDLSYNPFSCECGIHVTFQKWLTITNVTMVNFNDSNSPLAYICSEPREMEGKDLLDALQKCHINNDRKIGNIVVVASVLTFLVVFGILVILSCWCFRGSVHQLAVGLLSLLHQEKST